MTSSTVSIRIDRFPEALAAIRREVVRALNQEADTASDPRVARAIRGVAVQFEIGLTQRDEDSTA